MTGLAGSGRGRAAAVAGRRVDGGQGKDMRRTIAALLGLILLFGGAGSSRAEVKRVQMRIGGYLCGN